jgi:hypothetical protein
MIPSLCYKNGGVASPAREALSEIYGLKMKKLDPHTTTTSDTTQTPFEKFKAATSQVVTFPKSSLPKTPKKSGKK